MEQEINYSLNGSIKGLQHNGHQQISNHKINQLETNTWYFPTFSEQGKETCKD